MEYDIHLPARHHVMMLEHINKCAFLLLQALHKQRPLFLYYIFCNAFSAGEFMKHYVRVVDS